MKWILIITLSSSGMQQVPMASESACVRAANDLRQRDYYGLCIQKDTGQVIEGGEK